MCGICGIISFKNKIDEDRLLPMLDVIRYRGPNHTGSSSDRNFVAGMNRLAIVDLDGGNQPIYNEDKSITVFFNGEIYNFVELRKQLIKLGHKFYTNADTEVIAHLYEEYDIDFISMLNGMFSIFLVDKNRELFYLIRDNLGVKPLYYSTSNEYLVFASEIKSILKSGLIEKRISQDAIMDYFSLLYIPSPKTPFSNIVKLPAGSYLRIDKNGQELKKWYDLSHFCDLSNNNFATLSSKVRYLLDDSVRLQMRSDVPVGANLSGGVDSSLLTAIASRYSSIPLKTFSVGFESSEYDELPYAREVANIFGTEHHEVVISHEDAVKLLPEIMWYMDEPIGDSASLPSFLVSKLASNHVKVVLSGLGGDELFGGYSRYEPKKSKLEALNFVPTPILEMIEPGISKIIPAFKKQLQTMLLSDARKYFNSVRQLDLNTIKSLMGDKISLNNELFGKDLIDTFNSYPGTDRLNRRMYTDINLYMNDQLLQLTDRMSMSASVEARVPFLDHRLVELAQSIPSEYKINNKRSKILLKEAYKGVLPSSIIDRKKWGFASPVKTWVTSNGMQELIEQTISGALVQDGILSAEGVKKFLGNEEMIEKYSTWVWPIISLELWYCKFKDL